MRPRTSWWRVIRTVLIWVALASIVGWAFGRPLLFALLALLAVISSWLYQLWRIQQWMQTPGVEPPEAPGIWGDITDAIYHQQRRTREHQGELETSVEFLRATLGAMRDAVVITSETGNIQWSNTSAEQLLGLEFPRDADHAILNLIRRPEFHTYMAEENFAIPLQMQSPRDVDIKLQLTVTEFGEANRLLFVRDVTAMTRLEQVRRDFVANVSHELRTPLTVITGYLSTIQDSLGDLDPRITRPVQQMMQQSQRMEILLNDLLLLARIEYAEQRPGAEPVSVVSLLKELEKEYGAAHPEHPLTVSIETDATVPGSYKELYSAISNLVGNAMKYSPDGAPVDIYWRQTKEGCRLSVRDQGIGIDPVHHDRLTERFYRVDKSRSTSTGGTGLGLAIVKHVVAAHGAELRIDSALGEGSTFSILFPAEPG